jgi:tetratricopeptide (TPR) repeat protein
VSAPTSQNRDSVEAVANLAKHGLTDAVIMNYASQHPVSPALTADEITYLKASGVSAGTIDRLNHGPAAGAPVTDAADLLKSARDHFHAQKYPEAIGDCNRLLGIDPANPEAWYFKGLAEDNTHNTSDAALCFGKFVALVGPQDAKYATSRAYAVSRLKILSGNP